MRPPVRTALAIILAGTTCAIQAQSSRWGNTSDPTVKAIIAMEKMWFDSNCGPQPGLKNVIADDFQGTDTEGQRYGKKQAMEFSFNKECRVSDVKVQFFGETVAITFGDASVVGKMPDGTSAKRCLAWTDTWLKRSGKWQIIAAQDTIVTCK